MDGSDATAPAPTSSATAARLRTERARGYARRPGAATASVATLVALLLLACIPAPALGFSTGSIRWRSMNPGARCSRALHRRHVTVETAHTDGPPPSETIRRGIQLPWRKRDRSGYRHDDVIVRSKGSKGIPLAIPQAQRYSSRDWLHILRQTPSSVVLRRIREPVMYNVLWAAAIALVQQYSGFIPGQLFVQPHALIGGALGLLLVFRTNAAYNRFWEGRQLWDTLVSESRSLARLCVLYREEMTARKLLLDAQVRRVANLICVFANVLHEHVTSSGPSDEVAHLLTKEDHMELSRVANRPLCVLNKIGRELRSIPDKNEGDQILFSSRERLALISRVERMNALIGACERLVQTPVPLNYARHTSRFLTIWCLTLPFALVGEFSLAVAPIQGLICWGLFGIQEIGLMIEEPFRRSLKLDVITRTIFVDVLETIQMAEWWDAKPVTMEEGSSS